MANHGFYGFVYNGKPYITYNNFDSNPENLGIRLIYKFSRMLECWGMKYIKQLVSEIELIGIGVSSPISQTKKFHNMFEYMVPLQGELAGILLYGKMSDDYGFIFDPSCVWGYVFNLDTNEFEVYYGNQYKKHDKFGSLYDKKDMKKHSSFNIYPVAQICKFPIGRTFPKFTTGQFLTEISKYAPTEHSWKGK